MKDKNVLNKLFNKKGILFIDAGKPGDSIYGYSKPLAISILQTIAENKGIKSDFISLDMLVEQPNLIKYFEMIKKDYGMIAISSTSPGHARIINIFKKLKHNGLLKDIIIIKGGIHETEAAILLQKQLDYPIDFSFIGEADKSFERFLSLIEIIKKKKSITLLEIEKKLQEIKSIHYIQNEVTPIKEIVSSEEFVLPFYEFIEIEEPYEIMRKSRNLSSNHRMIRVMTMRGCLFGCIFCAINKNARRISPEKAVNYIKYLIEKAKENDVNIGYIFFEDATFTIEERLNLPLKKWSREFAKLLKKKNISIYFGIQTRIDCLNEEIIKILSSVGLRSVYLGVESLDDTNLKLFSKGILLEKERNNLVNIVNSLHKYGVKVSASIIHIPGKEKSLLNTFKTLLDMKINEIFVECYKVYPGTYLSLRYGKDKITEMYNQGVNEVISPNKEDRNCIIVDANGQIHTKFNCYFIYKELRKVIEGKNYVEISPGHYLKKDK